LAGPLGDWNYGFISGFWSYFLEFMIISIGYFLLISCLAEMTSIVAFASGAYGYVRCSVGPFYGFMIAVCEVMQNSFVAITCIYAVSDAITVTSGLSPSYEPLWMFLCYLCLFLLQCRGGWYFWTAMCIFAVTSALLVVLYCLSVLVSPDPAHANLVDESHEKFSRGGSRFIVNLYRPIWLYIGAETVTISGKNIANVSAPRLSNALLGAAPHRPSHRAPRSFPTRC
jgi:amino acid transporter